MNAVDVKAGAQGAQPATPEHADPGSGLARKLDPGAIAAPLFFAIVATQIVAVLMCAYGVLVPALPRALIGVVWAYVIVWTILTDVVKLVFNSATADRKQETPLTAHAMPIR